MKSDAPTEPHPMLVRRVWKTALIVAAPASALLLQLHGAQLKWAFALTIILGVTFIFARHPDFLKEESTTRRPQVGVEPVRHVKTSGHSLVWLGTASMPVASPSTHREFPYCDELEMTQYRLQTHIRAAVPSPDSVLHPRTENTDELHTAAA